MNELDDECLPLYEGRQQNCGKSFILLRLLCFALQIPNNRSTAAAKQERLPHHRCRLQKKTDWLTEWQLNHATSSFLPFCSNAWVKQGDPTRFFTPSWPTQLYTSIGPSSHRLIHSLGHFNPLHSTAINSMVSLYLLTLRWEVTNELSAKKPMQSHHSIF